MPGCNRDMDENTGNIIGYIHSVETLGASDGPGLRYVAFLHGCPLSCAFCHNPDTWHGKAPETMTASELCEDILRYRAYLTGGVTFSGGEPLAQPGFVWQTANLLRARAGMHTAIDTSGAIFSREVTEAIDAVDLILLDIKAFEDETAVRLTGCDTRNAWKILEYCEETSKKVWIRQVLVPGFTIFETDEHGEWITDPEIFSRVNEKFSAGIRRLSKFSCVEKIELLPFHKMGEFKWEQLQKVAPLRDTPEPRQESVDLARETVESILASRVVR